jgi:hypothetical protein
VVGVGVARSDMSRGSSRGSGLYSEMSMFMLVQSRPWHRAHPPHWRRSVMIDLSEVGIYKTERLTYHCAVVGVAEHLETYFLLRGNDALTESS